MGGARFIYLGGTGEIEEKKSRFIAHAEPIHSEEYALDFLSKVKKRYWDARHNCYAYVLGERHQLRRCSDDGEPAGTAGRPILDVLLREDVHDCIIVVTRYFGGTLLGTGGLVRAYQKAAQEGLAAGTVLEKYEGCPVTIKTDYTAVGKIQYILAQGEAAAIDSRYTDHVELDLMIPAAKKEHLVEVLMNVTGGTAQIDIGEPVFYALYKDDVILL